MFRWKLCLIGAAILTIVLVVTRLQSQPSREVLLNQVRRAMAERNLPRAESLARSALKRFHSDPEVWLVAGEVSARSANWQESLNRYEHVVSSNRELRAQAAYGCGEACVQLNKFERAERKFREALEADPHAFLALRRLVDVLIFTGRRHRAAPWLERVIPTPYGTIEDLFHLGDLDHLVSRPASVWTAVQDSEADPHLVLGAGTQALMDGRYTEAAALFERVVQSLPNDPDALAGWGQALLQTTPGKMYQWIAKLPAQVTSDVGVQNVLGQMADQEGRPIDAAFRFSKVVTQRPTSRIAWHQLGTALRRIGKTSEAELALERAQQLQELGTRLNDLFGQRQNLVLVRTVAEQLAGMGRTVEASAWVRHALSVSPNEVWAIQLLERLERSPATVINGRREQAIARLLSSLRTQAPVASVETPGIASRSVGNQETSLRTGATDASTPNHGRIRFEDAAQATGLDFIYHSARDNSTPGARIIETTGGGIGVVDYDADDWPDLYFTQGSRDFPLPENNPDLDRLLRNRNGLAWIDVSLLAGLGDAQLGQGIAVGDYNNDGFADLYLANYGFNVLYQNQGDGTFRDVTLAAIRDRSTWTSSCVIADLNGDGLPDLFDATYCGGDDVETRLCQKQGKSRSCSPRVFSAEEDRFWLNRGDGDWELCTEGLDLPQGYGLGVVAFRSSPDSPLGLFVANDETPNFWLVNTQNQPGGQPHWEDRALLGGLAVDAEGQSQACMGVACDDVNGDGLPDLFVTNFYQESNTLYLAATQEFFEDRTRLAQLREPGWNMLGFGTQFVDADLDGWPDLLVANGHIDDLTDLEIPFRMPLQCFQNRAGSFRELTSKDVGECFAKPALGRGLARLDWNRDGREDAVIVNQDSPAVLLKNASEETGNSIVLQFRGTSCARDAIGTIVRVDVGSRILTRQLTAGDGFQASNERQLVIGIGAVTTVDKIEVFWPDGVRQVFDPLLTNNRYLVIQGRQEIIPR